MMTTSEARTEISNFATALLRLNLAVAINAPTVINVGQVARVTWPAAGNSPGLFAQLPFASIVEYRQFVLDGQYIAMLGDGALFQISIDIRNNDVVGHRMCYYPCPILIPSEFDVTDFDNLDLLLLEDLTLHTTAISSGNFATPVSLRLRSPLRFDYSPHAASPTEPASHVHLCDPNARIAVHAPLSVGHFTRFVFKHFYPTEWADPVFNAVTRWPLRQMNRSITEEEELGLHVDCGGIVPPLAQN